MNVQKMFSFLMASLLMVSMVGCGGGSGGTSSGPFGGGTTAPVTISTGLVLSPNLTTVGANGGQVVITATVVNNGVVVSGAPVTFKIVAPTNGVAALNQGVVNTDTKGQAVTTITTGNSSSTTNVIVSGQVVVGAQTFTANTTFQIVRGATGTITFTTLASTNSAAVDPNSQSIQVFRQQISFKLLDANGQPRVGIPVNLSYTLSGIASVSIPASVTTDSVGIGIFTAEVTMDAAAADSFVIYKATTDDVPPVDAYASATYSVTTSTSTNAATIGLTAAQTSANSGSVLVTAKVSRNNQGLSGVPVTFRIIAQTNGPATISPGLDTVTTDSNGEAITLISTTNMSAVTNVILQASSATGIRATSTFQIVPTLNTAQAGITFLTGAGTSDPNGTLTTLTHTEPYNSSWQQATFNQLIPFKLTDAVGNPRSNVPVILDVYSQAHSSFVVIDYLRNGFIEATANTVTTDSAGMGIFNVTVTVPVPSPGGVFTDGIVYQAKTNDSVPFVKYGGFTVTSIRTQSPNATTVTVTPGSAHFISTDPALTTLQFAVSGGQQPYTVIASNPSLVSVAVRGATVTATLVDASAWTGSVSFSVIDSNGTAALAAPTIARQ
jgi:hypothetical protein